MTSPLWKQRFHIVTGKGGVGKSTVSAALALAAQADGLRVLVCEMTGQERVAGLLGAPPSGTEVRQIDRSIWSVHVRPAEAMREYGLMVLRFKALYQAVFENRLVRYFLRAVPSLAEIVQLGKVYWHVQEEKDAAGRLRWDVVILDAPATGHAVTLLRTPQSILEIVRGEGPLVRDMRAMRACVTDPSIVRVHVVALPEEMPITEAVELHGRLVQEVGCPIGEVFLNGTGAEVFAADELARLDSSRFQGDPVLTECKAIAERTADLGRRSADAAARLTRMRGHPPVELPWIEGDVFGKSQIEQLSRILGQTLADSVEEGRHVAR